MSGFCEPSGGCLVFPRDLRIALAEELRRASGLLDSLAQDLASDEAVLREHLVSLQAIDLVTQMHAAIANILEAPAVPETLQIAGLADMTRRLSAA